MGEHTRIEMQCSAREPMKIKKYIFKNKFPWDTWVTQLIKCPTSAQVMISWFVGSSPASGSMLTAQSLEPPLYSVFPSPSVLRLLTLSLSLSQK